MSCDFTLPGRTAGLHKWSLPDIQACAQAHSGAPSCMQSVQHTNTMPPPLASRITLGAQTLTHQMMYVHTMGVRDQSCIILHAPSMSLHSSWHTSIQCKTALHRSTTLLFCTSDDAINTTHTPSLPMPPVLTIVAIPFVSSSQVVPAMHV